MSDTASSPTAVPATAEGHRLPRGRRYLVRGLLTLAGVLAVLAIIAVWANRQALDADNWASTSSQLLDDPVIRTQVAGFIVDEVYANVDVQGEVARALPPRFRPLAGPATGALRSVAERTTRTALGRPRVQKAWEEANRLTAQQFINVAEGKSTAITSQGNAVILDLRVVVLEIVGRLGLPASVAGKIPPDTGRIKILTGDQVSSVQNLVSALRSFAVVLPALALGLLALAVLLARGRRRETLLEAGGVLIVAGLLVLIARRVAGPQVVDSLAATDGVKPAVEHAYGISTDLLRDVAQATVILGVPIVLAAWLAGPQRLAVDARRHLAPFLREHPGLAYGAVVGLWVLIVAWGPLPATRSPIPVLAMLGLSLAGLEVLRRQTAAEFPPALPDAPAASGSPSPGATAPPGATADGTTLTGGRAS
jgi:hypothetical protein